MAPELDANHFCRGILLGLVDIRIDTTRLRDPAGHMAALKVFTYLQESARDQFDFTFVIILHPIYGESGDWANAASFQLVSGLATYCEGEYLTQARREDLDEWFDKHQPGSREFWKKCATVYRDAFVEHLRNPNPTPRPT